MPFLDSLDIANRACDHCGVDHILSVTEDSVRNNLLASVYDKLRRAELQRNTWTFATKRVALRPMSTTSLLLVPSLYSTTVTYLFGAIVQDANGELWFSRIPDNLNNTPGGNTEAWERYFGPQSVDIWSSTISYYPGELVYVITGTAPNGYQVYMSRVGANTAVPGTANAWSATTTYGSDDCVSYGGSQWRSLLPINLNQTPANPPLPWAAGTTYSSTNLVVASDNFVYQANGTTTGNDPTTDGGTHWVVQTTMGAWMKTSPTLLVSSTAWLPVVATLKTPSLFYPVGSGPSEDPTTYNVFHKPSGYLKIAPQDPKAGEFSYLGAPSNIQANTWQQEGPYIVAHFETLILLRFVADVTQVRVMHDMFCEGLGCRMAIEASPTINQSTEKLKTIGEAYGKFMSEARIVNAIEAGVTEPPLDDYIACRI